jgi:hypothetical protein
MCRFRNNFFPGSSHCSSTLLRGGHTDVEQGATGTRTGKRKSERKTERVVVGDWAKAEVTRREMQGKRKGTCKRQAKGKGNSKRRRLLAALPKIYLIS